MMEDLPTWALVLMLVALTAFLVSGPSEPPED
jgi:hypothetical protein